MPAGVAAYSHDKRDETMTPLHGAHRQGQVPEGNNKNALLVKPMLGTVKATCYDLPSLPSKNGLQHEYGLRQIRSGETSADVVGNWASHEPDPNAVTGRDFKALNKHAVVEGVCSNKTMTEYRSTHDFRLKLGSDKPPDVKPYDASTAFGRPTNASTSFNDLFSHSYRYDWATEAPTAEQCISSKKPKKPKQTKTSLAMVQAAQAKLDPPKEGPKWKMTSFADVPPKVGYTG